MQHLRLVRQFGSNLRRRWHSTDVFPKSTMNDLPQPKGSWQENFNKNQKKYNRDLALGVIFTAGTLAFGEYMGYHEFFGGPPDAPAKIDTYRVEQ